MSHSKPLLIISGFLGAGKTTLLRRILASLDGFGLGADIILNDFANAEIDSATLTTRSAFSVAPIAAGCACCESLEELTSLCEAAAQGTGDLLLIELNGTADPLTLHESFTILEDRLPFFPRLQVCVIDARHWNQRQEYTTLERRQLETAGFWFVSHSEHVRAERLAELRSSLRALAPNAIETDVARLVQTLRQDLAAESPSRSNPPLSPIKTDQRGHQPVHRQPAPASAKDPTHRLSHRFTGCQLQLPPRVRSASMRRLLENLPDWVLRAKALVKLVEEPGCRWLFERIGKETIPQPMPVSDLRGIPSSMVCIGPRLDADSLNALVSEEFGTAWKASNPPDPSSRVSQ